MSRTLRDFDTWTYLANYLGTQVWLVNQATTNGVRTGFFKHHWGNPHIGLDYVISRIANELELDVPEVALAKVANNEGEIKDGLVSLSVPAPYYTWAFRAPTESQANYDEPWRMFSNLEKVIGLYVLDVWVGNTDRHGENILLQQVDPYPRWAIWGIDHGHVFNNANWLAPDCPLQAFELRPEDCFRIDQALKGHLFRRTVQAAVSQRFENLLQWVEKIHQLDNRYESYIDICITANILSTEQADRLKQVLTARRAKLEEMIHQWSQRLMAERGSRG